MKRAEIWVIIEPKVDDRLKERIEAIILGDWHS